ncbi:MAG TPA: peroxide stress protein YaaA, partial [Jatrophihabitans sp.]|nr:peroxide stress protein YaaA [Jatrophihabitans sp.]
TSPTMPALRRYTGVVYAGFDAPGLSAKARELANQRLLIFSGLFGVLRATEPVPAYRVPASAVLPGLGVLATFWRKQLTEPLVDLLGRRGPIVDLRSTDYAAMWQPAPSSAQSRRLLTVRVLSRRPGGEYGVISYQSKLAKGRLAAALLERAAQGLPVRGSDDIEAAWTGLGGQGAERRPQRIGQALDLYE